MRPAFAYVSILTAPISFAVIGTKNGIAYCTGGRHGFYSAHLTNAALMTAEEAFAAMVAAIDRRDAAGGSTRVRVYRVLIAGYR